MNPTRYATRLQLLGALLALAPAAHAQADLLGQLEKQAAPAPAREPVLATFKGTHIINSQSVETPGQGTLIFLIQHRFGTLRACLGISWAKRNEPVSCGGSS